jgi:hypothetical protein
LETSCRSDPSGWWYCWVSVRGSAMTAPVLSLWEASRERVEEDEDPQAEAALRV